MAKTWYKTFNKDDTEVMRVAESGSGNTKPLAGGEGGVFCCSQTTKASHIQQRPFKDQGRKHVLTENIFLGQPWSSTDVMPTDKLSQRLGTGGTDRAPFATQKKKILSFCCIITVHSMHVVPPRPLIPNTPLL